MRPRTEDVAALRRELNIPANAPIVGGMFRFNAEKRPFLWLEAASRVARAMPEAHFVLFGNGRLRAKMQRMAKSLGIAARLRMPGVFAPSLLGLSLFDLLLLTSSGEGTPNVLLEAQWLGVPIVTTDAGGAKEAIDPGVTGLVAGEDKATIANTVIEALEDKVFRDRARSAGPRFVAERYGMERMIRETLAAYGYPARDRANAAGARETLS
jgi:glycosyltransferase involved in cell wall biosynthesis